jgi:hypothetical protein
MQIFYTQDFLDYVADQMATMPCVLTSGNISDNATITDTLIIGEIEKSGKKYKTKGTVEEQSIKEKTKEVAKKIPSPVWDFSTATEYTTSTSFIYDEKPSSGLIKEVFELCFNTTSEYICIPFSTTSEFCPSTISDDYGGSAPSIYWGNENSLTGFWNCTVGEPTIINGTNIEFYFDVSIPEYQCTIPTILIGFGTNPSDTAPEDMPAYGGFIFANKNIILEDETNLIIYAGLLDETIEMGLPASVLQYVMSIDSVII